MTKGQIRALKVVGGSIGGALLGAVAAPLVTAANMMLDAAAPVTYPVMCAVGGASGAAIGAGPQAQEPKVMAVCALIGGLAGVGMTPAAPVIMATRPFMTPVIVIATGATAGGLLVAELTK